ncbi:hypothetical protein NDU88_007007 [Pleurodeles waltl]|uniref:Uncharacterized protein n=1 Tax=Pleurodeles waltl TaxID=8319 RepID=A0AAV7PK00_PLEWA|nr:hypothetical protein NDU88_007007 [Pleurodeles waltl]
MATRPDRDPTTDEEEAADRIFWERMFNHTERLRAKERPGRWGEKTAVCFAAVGAHSSRGGTRSDIRGCTHRRFSLAINVLLRPKTPAKVRFDQIKLVLQTESFSQKRLSARRTGWAF